MNAMSPAVTAGSDLYASVRENADADFVQRLLPGIPTPHSCRVLANALSVLFTTSLGDATADLVALEEGLNEQALSLPVGDIQDAAALLALGAESVELLEEHRLDQETAERQIKILQRILASVLPFLLREASAPAGELGCERFLRRQVEQVPA